MGIGMRFRIGEGVVREGEEGGAGVFLFGGDDFLDTDAGWLMSV